MCKTVMAAGRSKLRTEIHRFTRLFKDAAQVSYSRQGLQLDVINKCPVGQPTRKLRGPRLRPAWTQGILVGDLHA